MVDHQSVYPNLHFCMFVLNLTPCLTKPRVLVLCVPYFTDNSIVFWGGGWGERKKRAHLISKSTKTRKHTLNPFSMLCLLSSTQSFCCYSPAKRMGSPNHICGIPKGQYIYHDCSIKNFSIRLG